MKMKFLLSLFVFCLATAVPCYGQDSTNHQSWSPAGIGVQAGIGYFAVRDDHLSSEKYSGPTSWFAWQWSRFHETYGYRIGMTYQKAPDLKNHNVSSEVTLGGFNVVNLYPTGACTLFGTDISTYLGPSADVFIYYRKQLIAKNTDATPNVYESGAWLFSTGAQLAMIAPFNDALQAEGSFQMSLLSLGGGSGNSRNNSTAMKLLSPFGAMHASLELGLRYHLLARLSFAGGYRFDLLRVNSWNYMLAASDNGFVSLVYQP